MNYIFVLSLLLIYGGVIAFLPLVLPKVKDYYSVQMSKLKYCRDTLLTLGLAIAWALGGVGFFISVGVLFGHTDEGLLFDATIIYVIGVVLYGLLLLYCAYKDAYWDLFKNNSSGD